MTRTDTPTPFAEGQRNADILVSSPTGSAVSRALSECGRYLGRFEVYAELGQVDDARHALTLAREHLDAAMGTVGSTPTLAEIEERLIAEGTMFPPCDCCADLRESA